MQARRSTMWLVVSPLLVALFHVRLIATFCKGESRNLSVQFSQSPIHFSTPATSSSSRLFRRNRTTFWRQIPRSGSIASVDPPSKNVQKIPSLFLDESDAIYDRYAACLAATEGLRRIRDETLQTQQQELGNKQQKDRLSSSPSKKDIREAKQWAITVYAENASKVVEAMGMTVSQFNSIGTIVCKDSSLKQKVLEQAYLYRLQSNVELDTIPEINQQQQKSFRPISRDKFHKFCESMYEIESLRRERAQTLKQTFQVNEMPSISGEPTIRPLLDSKIRDAMDSFPIAASAVVQQFGLKNDEFNALLQRTRASTFFRWKVLRNIGRIERQRME